MYQPIGIGQTATANGSKGEERALDMDLLRQEC
jgi:hypothetical protein